MLGPHPRQAQGTYLVSTLAAGTPAKPSPWSPSPGVRSANSSQTPGSASKARGVPTRTPYTAPTHEPARKRIAKEVRKTLESAIANAENNHGLDIDSLVVSEAYVGKNLVMKRYKARARGRGAKILKPFSELTIVVREVEEAA